MKYTARQYRTDLSRAQAALREAQRQDEMLCLELEQTDYPSLDPAAKARFTARFDSVRDLIWDLEQDIIAVERRWIQRDWNWQDHSEARLVALNID